MERTHKKHTKMLFAFIFALSFILRWNFTSIASDSISFISIALAIYTVSIGALIGSSFAEELKNITHRERKDLTQLDMISNYMKLGIIMSMITIILSLVVKLDHSFLLELFHIMIIDIFNNETLWRVLYGIGKQIFMSTCFSFLSMNFIFMWYVFKFIINRQVDNR